MKDFFVQILTLGYASVGFMSVVGYWPTIRDLYHQKNQSANSASFGIWTAASVIVVLYSLFVSSDVLFRAVSIINLACSLVVLFLSVKFGRF